MADQGWRGIFVILITPFRQDLSVDHDSLRRQIDFCVEAGVHGVVGPANASEFATLSDAERMDWIRTVADACAGRVPFVAAANGLHARPAAELAAWTEAQGADGIMAMPPYVLHPDEQGCFDFYRTMAGRTSVPIVVQNFIGPVGTPMSAALLGRLCRELPTVQYIKAETLPEPRAVTDALRATGDACKGVFGGQGGVHLLDEHRRGCCGNMPASQLSPAHVRIWNLLETGDPAAARAAWNQLLPLIAFERTHGVAAYKEVMQRRGLFATNLSRMPGAYLDPEDLQELDAILELAEPALAGPSRE